MTESVRDLATKPENVIKGRGINGRYTVAWRRQN